MEWDPTRIGPRWRKAIAEGIWGALSRTWDPRYDGEARRMVLAAVSRVIDAMTGDGQYGLGECARDGFISQRWIPAGRFFGRGDYRYSPDAMAEYLRTNIDRDLVPIVCSPGRGGYQVLDGHHRVRAYDEVMRPVPSLVCHVEPGTGLIRLT